jgi:hypothetical protein
MRQSVLMMVMCMLLMVGAVAVSFLVAVKAIDRQVRLNQAATVVQVQHNRADGLVNRSLICEMVRAEHLPGRGCP